MSGAHGAFARLAAALALGCVVLTGCSGSDHATDAPPSAGAPVGRCDWPTWGQSVTRDFAAPCPAGLSTATAASLRRIWFANTGDVVTATPAVVDGTVYVGDWAGTFYALRLDDGKPRWKFRTTPQRQVYAGQIVSSAAVADVDGRRTVYFGGGKTLYALNAADGSLRWKHVLHPDDGRDDPTEIESSPAVVDGMVVVGWDVHNSADGEPAGVIALDASSGATRWTFETTTHGRAGPGCGDVWSSPSVDTEHGLVFAATGNCVTSPTGYGRYAEAMFALDLRTGAPRWTYQPHQPNRDDLDFAGAPNLFDANGRALVGLGNKDATYYALDRLSGAAVWSRKVTEPGLTNPGSNFSTGGFIGPSAYSDGTIVGATAVGGNPYLHALDAATGAIRWQQPLAAPTYAAAAIANGVVFIGGTDFTFRALDLRTGRVLWSQPMQGAVSGGAAIVGDDVIAVAGIREPGLDKPSTTSGVYRFSLHGTPEPSTTTGAPATTATSSGPRPQPTKCVASPCAVPFDLVKPPAGTSPSMTVSIRPQPFRVEAHASGLGTPAAWLRPGSAAAQQGATVFAVVLSERDDNPTGGLVCILDPAGSCTGTTIPRPGATYNRLSVLAVLDPGRLPGPAEGINRLVTTISFEPPLAPGAG